MSFAFRQQAAAPQRSASAVPTPGMARPSATSGVAAPAAQHNVSDSPSKSEAAAAALSALPLMEEGAGFDDYQFDQMPPGGLEEQLPKIDWSGKTTEEIVGSLDGELLSRTSSLFRLKPVPFCHQQAAPIDIHAPHPAPLDAWWLLIGCRMRMSRCCWSSLRQRWLLQVNSLLCTPNCGNNSSHLKPHLTRRAPTYFATCRLPRAASAASVNATTDILGVQREASSMPDWAAYKAHMEMGFRLGSKQR